MIALYMDENVQESITLGLRQRGLDVITVHEDYLRGASDPEVFRRAIQLKRVLFSRDDDMLREASLYQQNEETFVGLIYAHQNILSVGECIQNLEY